MPKSLEIVPKQHLTMVSVNDDRMIHMVPHVLKFGSTTVPAHDKYDYPCHQEFEFCFRLCSEDEYAEDEMDGEVYRNTFPHLFVKKPFVPYRYKVHAQRYAKFIIYPAASMTEFISAGICLDPPGIEFQMDSKIKAMLAELGEYETSVHEKGNPDRIDLLAFQLISTVCIQHRTGPEEPEQIKKIRRIASVIEADPASVHDLSELASQYGFSRRSFFRCWHKLYHLSPTQFLIEKKMNLAQRLLLSGTRQISDIADLLGFSSSSYFIQAFKSRFHVSPALYRTTAIKRDSTES